MPESATAVAARPPAAALLDKKMHKSHAMISGAVVLIALIIGIWFIATHVCSGFQWRDHGQRLALCAAGHRLADRARI